MDQPFLPLSPALRQGSTRPEVETHRSRIFPSPSPKLQEKKWVPRWERQTQDTGSALGPPRLPKPHPIAPRYTQRPLERQRVLPPCRTRTRIRELTDLGRQLAMVKDLIRICGIDELGPDDFDELMSLLDEVQLLQQHTIAVLRIFEARGLSPRTS